MLVKLFKKKKIEPLVPSNYSRFTYQRYTKEAILIFRSARQEAKKMPTLNNAAISSEHLFIALFECPSIINSSVFKKTKINNDELKTKLLKEISKVDNGISKREKNLPEYVINRKLIKFTPKVNSIIEWAIIEAELLDHYHLGAEHLLLAVCQENYVSPALRETLKFFDLTPTKLRMLIYQEIKELYPSYYLRKIKKLFPIRKKYVTASYRQRNFLNNVKENSSKEDFQKVYAEALLQEYTNEQILAGMKIFQKPKYKSSYNLTGKFTNLFKKKPAI